MSQERILVEHFVRQPGEQWLLTMASSLEAAIDVSLDARLMLGEVYERVPELAGSPPAQAPPRAF